MDARTKADRLVREMQIARRGMQTTEHLGIREAWAKRLAFLIRRYKSL